MYAQIHNGAYVAQAPHAYATAPVSATVATNGWPTGIHNVNPYNMAAMAYNPSVAYPGLPAPPAPPGVNLQHWQNGRWAYNVPQQSQQVYNAKPTGPAAVAAAASAALAATYPPPTMVGWTVPASWGVPAQYYHPSALPQKQRDPSYWNTQLTDNGLMLENMHISRYVFPLLFLFFGDDMWWGENTPIGHRSDSTFTFPPLSHFFVTQFIRSLHLFAYHFHR